jgi:diacylglycerol kinase family enzyme
MDGEAAGETPFEVRLMPGALAVLGAPASGGKGGNGAA